MFTLANLPTIRTILLADVLEVRISYTSQSWQDFFLASDIHLDNPKCDRALLTKHLNEARSRNAPILFFGDVLCLMQGKFDKRGSKSSIRPEHQGANYFDLVFEESAEFLKPWADLIIMLADGNHETAVLTRNEIDPLEHVTKALRDKHKSPVVHTPYQGFVRFVFERPDGGKVRTSTLFYHHGAWGGIVTKGTLGGMRYSAIAPDANIFVNGHNHERSMVCHPCHRLMGNGKKVLDSRWHIQTGTYKNEFSEGGGWAVEKIVIPKSLGGCWLRLRPVDGGVDISAEFAV